MSVENVKVGDKIRCLVTEYNVVAGEFYEVVGVGIYGGSLCVRDEVNDNWWLGNGEWEHIATFAANDTVRLKSGEPFTDGNYTAEVDSVRSDIVLLKLGSWLPLDAVEKVEVRFKVGDYVRVTDNGTPGGTFKPVQPGTVTKIARAAPSDGWMLEGSGVYFYLDSQLEPVEAPTTPLVLTLSVDTSSFSRDLADQFQRIADALRAA